MGVVDAIFGAQSDSAPAVRETEPQKYAILLNTGPADPPVASNGFNYALEFDDAGYDVELYLDGKATKWPAEFEDNPDLPFSHAWEQIRDRGLLTGACGYCANAFEVAAGCERTGVELLSDRTEHAPAVATLADEGYELLTI